MKRRNAVHLVVWSVLTAAGCSSTSAPALPSCSSALASQVALSIGRDTTLDPAADSGCVTFAANLSAIDSVEYLLVPQSTAGTFGESSPFLLRTTTLTAAAPAVGQGVIPSSSPRLAAVQFDGFLRHLARSGPAGAAVLARSAAAAAPTLAAPQPAGPPSPGSMRTFTVCANLTCSSFQSVTATATTVGTHIAIYVDNLAPKPGLNSADLDTLKQEFDSQLYPLDTATFGGVSDIDANSVVIVLMTGVVNKLVSKATCLSRGFIAGFFFSADLEVTAPSSVSNHGEVFYSIVVDSAGKLSCAHSRAEVKRVLPGTFTHEFQHMISYVQHVLVRVGQSEEGWLDEGLSKYAEELAGRSYLPGDTAKFSQYAIGDVYDAYQYLSATGTSPLLIEFDQGTLAEVGASWLFVRYLVDQYGAALPGKLDQTTLSGAVNVAAQTGHAFDTTVTRWALANWVSDLPGFTAPPELQYTSWHFRTTYASLNAQDPANFPLPYPLVPTRSAGSAVSLSGTLRSGSGVYQRALQGPSAPAYTLLFRRSATSLFPTALGARLNVIRIR